LLLHVGGIPIYPPQTSYSRKRKRQMNPLYQLKNAQNFYPCPKCEHGYLKLRHHICPCDQEKMNVSHVVKVRARAAAVTAPGHAARGLLNRRCRIRPRMAWRSACPGRMSCCVLVSPTLPVAAARRLYSSVDQVRLWAGHSCSGGAHAGGGDGVRQVRADRYLGLVAPRHRLIDL
jgi:ribosomal protein L32